MLREHGATCNVDDINMSHHRREFKSPRMDIVFCPARVCDSVRSSINLWGARVLSGRERPTRPSPGLPFISPPLPAAISLQHSPSQQHSPSSTGKHAGVAEGKKGRQHAAQWGGEQGPQCSNDAY
eukprot:1157225-Pelagomonas_calceolata.AAC.5